MKLDEVGAHEEPMKSCSYRHFSPKGLFFEVSSGIMAE